MYLLKFISVLRKINLGQIGRELILERDVVGFCLRLLLDNLRLLYLFNLNLFRHLDIIIEFRRINNAYFLTF
jgi:hypothetical protein